MLPFGLCYAPTTFQRAVIRVFFDMFVDCMDDFTIYESTFDEAKSNLDKVLKRCQEHNLSLNSEKYYTMMVGVALGHYISSSGIQVDLHKIEVNNTLPTPAKKKDVRSFLGHASY